MTWRQSPVIVENLTRCRFPSHDHVSCAVSGGADSLALMVLAVASGRRVTAIHVDHGLRPNSADEGKRVRAFATEIGAEYIGHSVRVASGPNVEARARAARYALLPVDVLTGHTADDQAETVLVNLLRGAGLDGLSGMRDVGGPSGSVGHPLLALRRSDTESVCAVMGWTPFHDPSNDDESLLRNRIRHTVLPLLHDVAGRDLTAVLVRQAALLADDADFLDSLAREIDPTDAKAVAAAPVVLARRAVRRWLADHHPPDAASVERVLSVARGDAVACELPGGVRVQRTNQRISITPAPEQG